MNPPMFGHFTPRPEGVEADVTVVVPHARVNLLVQPEQETFSVEVWKKLKITDIPLFSTYLSLQYIVLLHWLLNLGCYQCNKF